VEDGWAAEVEWWQVGWGLEGFDDGRDTGQIYDYLESSIVPAFYDRDADGIPREWVAMMRRSMKMTLSRFSARRMVLEYVDKLYLPLVAAQRDVVTT
jgi:starch phosphorylase